MIDCRLTFPPQIDMVVSKAKQRIYLLLMSFQSRNVSFLVFAFKTYILPILDYCFPVWNPNELLDIDRLECVQRRYTKRLEGPWNGNYADRLRICSLISLKRRRLLSDLLLCFKIVHYYIDFCFFRFFCI